MVRGSTVWFRFVVMVAALAIPVSAMSQSFYGSLVAVVEDAQSGVMPGATIILVNTATNDRRQGVSGKTAHTASRISCLALTGSKWNWQAFSATSAKGSKSTSSRRRASRRRCSSGTSQKRSRSPVKRRLLQTESASVGTVVGSRAVQELPLNGRNVLNLIAMAPTVVPQGGSEGSLTGKNVFAAGNYQIGGGSPTRAPRCTTASPCRTRRTATSSC